MWENTWEPYSCHHTMSRGLHHHDVTATVLSQLPEYRLPHTCISTQEMVKSCKSHPFKCLYHPLERLEHDWKSLLPFFLLPCEKTASRCHHGNRTTLFRHLLMWACNLGRPSFQNYKEHISVIYELFILNHHFSKT